MQISSRHVGDVTVFDLTGKLDIYAGSTQLREAVRSALEEGKSKLLVNLAGMTYVDSSGLGELISSYSTTSNRGGKLKLLNPTQKFMDLLMITRLISVFEVYEAEDEAVASFG